MSSNEWDAPKGYKLANEADRIQLVGDSGVRQVIDPINEIANDSFELHRTDQIDNPDERAHYVNEVLQAGAAYGTWFHFPWNDTLVRYPDEDEHYDLRTFRNRNLITKREQRILRGKKIAVFGLSVGSKTADELVAAGIGDSYLLADPDRLMPANLNRIRATMVQVGLLKTTVEGRKISAVDPYIDQQHLTGGYIGDETDALLRLERPDAIIEEVDDMVVKARLRAVAAELGVPLVMAGDVDDKSTIDIERHDLGEVKPFNGKLSKKQVEALRLGKVAPQDIEKLLIKILGLRNISPRLLDSAVDRAAGELAGFPQLGTTATAGGALTAVALRDIFLGRNVKSTAGVHDPRKIIKQGRPTTRAQDVRTVVRFIGYQLRQKRAKQI